MNDVIREGFLCPRCKRDFGSPQELLAHASECNFIEPVEISEESSWRPSNASSSIFEEYQAMRMRREDVPINRLTEQFKKERFGCARRTTLETNRLFCRLERLVVTVSRDSSPNNSGIVQSRSYNVLTNAFAKFGVGLPKEKSEERVCDWLPDAERPYCGRCRSRFSFQRRKHHCRLCGEVICEDCSLFLTCSEAKCLVAINRIDDVEEVTSTPAKRTMAWTNAGASSCEVSSGIKGAQMSETAIRICSSCSSLLETRKRERRALRDSTLSSIYKTVRNAIDALLVLRKDFNTAYDNAAKNHFRNAAECTQLNTLRREVITRAGELERIANDCYPSTRLNEPDKVDNAEMRVRRCMRLLAMEATRDVRFTLKPIPQNK
jgi:rabenosyn-5